MVEFIDSESERLSADDAAIEEIRFELQPIEFIQFGPAWARTWELSYFLLLILVSLGIKVAFKIH